jgi:CRP/FNR family transcriptional regulator
MAASIQSEDTTKRLEDVLAHLPISKTREYANRQVIYGLDSYPTSIYLVVKGTVAISHIANDGSEVLLDIVRPDDLFGESAFLQAPHRPERAEAIETAEVMSWSVSEMEDLVTKRPRLAVALLQILVQRNVEYTQRIESFAIDSIQRRLARSLLRLSDRLGTPEESGYVRMMPLSHGMLSRYIGTSREIVTHHMCQFRKQGYVDYSRRGISLHRDTLKSVLD